MSRNEKMLASKIGLGTWQMGSVRSERATEVAALKAGIEMGVTVLDTAEMYANGGAEEVTGEAIAGRRDDIFLVTKVIPSNASRAGTVEACERSLKRLGTDFIDLYLLHWPGSHPLNETVAAFEELSERGLIKQWGVSNFRVKDMQALFALESGSNCDVNQVYYSFGSRGVEFDLLPWQTEQDVATMAYCPLDQGRLVKDDRLQPIADKHGATIAQIALAWLMARPGVIPIPKSAKISRVQENVNATNLKLDQTDFAEIDRLFPPPTKAVPLKTT
ncbi:MAG: aldo/keto reductase [Anaerolineae bacterium]